MLPAVLRMRTTPIIWRDIQQRLACVKSSPGRIVLTKISARCGSSNSTSSMSRPGKRRKLLAQEAAVGIRSSTVTHAVLTDAEAPAAKPTPQPGSPQQSKAAPGPSRLAKRVGSTAAPAAKDDPAAIWMIVGLGNPGATYDSTRHNVGFRIVDELARADGIDMRKLEKGAIVGRGLVEGRQVILVKPITFMNNSGEATAALSKFYRIPLSRLLVISDDLDLPTATLRLRAKGGHGGHNGLRSIIERLGGTQDFPRIKVGIGRPPGQMGVAEYVLQPFTRAEASEIAVAVQDGVSVVRSVLKLGMDKALSGVRV